MGGLIISYLGSLREMIKRKERRRKRSRKSRRRRRSFSRWFLFSPPSSFPLLCLKDIAGRFGHKKICETLAIACKILYICISTKSKNIFLGFAFHAGRGSKVAEANQYDWYCDPMWLILSCEMIDIGSHNGWNSAAIRLRLDVIVRHDLHSVGTHDDTLNYLMDEKYVLPIRKQTDNKRDMSVNIVETIFIKW